MSPLLTELDLVVVAWCSGCKALKSEQSRLRDVTRRLEEAEEAAREAEMRHQEAVDGMQLDFESSQAAAR